MHTVRITFAAVGLLLCPVLVGCSASALSTGVIASPFLGNYNGTFAAAPSGDTGTIQLIVNLQGGVYGSVQDTTASKSGSIVGTIDASGNAVLNITYGNVTITESGLLSRDNNSHLVGTLTGHDTETIDLTPLVQ